MSYTKVRNYDSKELLERVSNLKGFVGFPQDYWIIGVRSNEDTYNVFDDKFYIFKGKTFIDVMTGTTNSGSYGILNFKKWNEKGVAQIKGNEIYYDCWVRGLHRGKVEALRQSGEFKVIRDGNKNEKLDIKEWSIESGNGLNFHPNSYNLQSKVKNWFIGGWSIGCQVINDLTKYVAFMKYTKPQNVFTYALLEEF